jgi:prepilin-type N-terminal cleavage/methylation domain-containing protein
MMKSGNQQGFTIIEALIAITLLAVGILAAATMQISAITGNSRANRITEANAMVADKVEWFMSRPYADDPADPVFVDDCEWSADGNYEICWTVEEDAPLDNTRTIRITVQQLPGVSMVFIKANEG